MDSSIQPRMLRDDSLGTTGSGAGIYALRQPPICARKMTCIVRREALRTVLVCRLGFPELAWPGRLRSSPFPAGGLRHRLGGGHVFCWTLLTACRPSSMKIGVRSLTVLASAGRRRVIRTVSGFRRHLMMSPRCPLGNLLNDLDLEVGTSLYLSHLTIAAERPQADVGRPAPPLRQVLTGAGPLDWTRPPEPSRHPRPRRPRSRLTAVVPARMSEPGGIKVIRCPGPHRIPGRLAAWPAR
jgi:hypothetical protein